MRPDYGGAAPGAQRYRMGFEWGWGPMKGYQVFDWQGRLRVEEGRITAVVWLSWRCNRGSEIDPVVLVGSDRCVE